MGQKLIDIDDFSADELNSLKNFAKDFDTSDEDFFIDDINNVEHGSGETSVTITSADPPTDVSDVASTDLAKTFRIVTRKDWCAKRPSYPGIEPMEKPAKTVLLRYYTGNPGHDVCHTDEQCRKVMLKLQWEHKQGDLRDIGANFLIGEDGTVYEGRGWMAMCESPDWDIKRAKVPHTKIDPRRLYNISYIGNFEEDQVTAEMTQSLKSLLEVGLEHGFLEKNYDLMEIIEQKML